MAVWIPNGAIYQKQRPSPIKERARIPQCINIAILLAYLCKFSMTVATPSPPPQQELKKP